MNIEQARFNMIEQQIRPWSVLDTNVLELLAVVKREDFVPAALKNLAFTDTDIPLGDGQWMLPPRLEARMLQDLQVQRHERVLEIGTGSGYMAALLARRAQSVLSVEIRPALARTAVDNLRRAGVVNVEVREADGSRAETFKESFDAIMLSGSVATTPRWLLKLLKPGGRLIAIEGEDPVMRAAVYTCTGTDAYARNEPFDCGAPRLEHFEEPPKFRF